MIKVEFNERSCGNVHPFSTRTSSRRSAHDRAGSSASNGSSEAAGECTNGGSGSSTCPCSATTRSPLSLIRRSGE